MSRSLIRFTKRLSNKTIYPMSTWSMKPTPLAKSSSRVSTSTRLTSWVPCVRIKAGKRMTLRPLISATFRLMGTRKSSSVPWANRVGPGNRPRAPAASRPFRSRFIARIVRRVVVRHRCTRSATEARGLTLHPKAQHLALQVLGRRRVRCAAGAGAGSLAIRRARSAWRSFHVRSQSVRRPAGNAARRAGRRSCPIPRARPSTGRRRGPPVPRRPRRKPGLRGRGRGGRRPDAVDADAKRGRRGARDARRGGTGRDRPGGPGGGARRRSPEPWPTDGARTGIRRGTMKTLARLGALPLLVRDPLGLGVRERERSPAARAVEPHGRATRCRPGRSDCQNPRRSWTASSPADARPPVTRLRGRTGAGRALEWPGLRELARRDLRRGQAKLRRIPGRPGGLYGLGGGRSAARLAPGARRSKLAARSEKVERCRSPGSRRAGAEGRVALAAGGSAYAGDAVGGPPADCRHGR